eukprot:scaffold29383_cov54-Prasinocladus_malaysianus.AAC.1
MSSIGVQTDTCTIQMDRPSSQSFIGIVAAFPQCCHQHRQPAGCPGREHICKCNLLPISRDMRSGLLRGTLIRRRRMPCSDT